MVMVVNGTLQPLTSRAELQQILPWAMGPALPPPSKCEQQSILWIVGMDKGYMGTIFWVLLESFHIGSTSFRLSSKLMSCGCRAISG